MYIIYSLIDPITNEVRYIGQTLLLRQKKRLYEHVKYAHKGKTHSSCWIRKLIRCGETPIMNVIEVVSKDNVNDREKYWIKQFDNLTNLTDGGQADFTYTPEIIEKFRIMNTGENNPCFGKLWTDEERLKLSLQRKGIPKSIQFKNSVSKTMGSEIEVNGINYQSIRSAQKELKIRFKTITTRLDSIDFPDWKRI